jgi:hypothetical protein
MSKVTPEVSTEVSTEVYVYETDTSDSSDSSYNVEQLKSKTKYLSYLFDTTIGNFPLGASIGLILTIVSTVMISVNLTECKNILIKYNNNLSDMSTYLYFLLGTLLILHSAVFSHGLSVGIIETKRELFQNKEIGCLCCKCCKTKKCRKIQKCNQLTCQIVWAVLGTGLIFLFYLFTIGLSTISYISTMFSYLLLQTCNLYTNFINDTISKSYLYLNQAKKYIGKADNVTTHFLYEYNKFIDLQEQFKNSAMNQLNTIETNTYISEKQEWSPMKYEHGRKLTVFNPTQSIAEGKSVIWTLNQTIIDTEKQINYYETQLQNSINFCNDYSSIYDSLYFVSIGTILLLIAHFIIFAVHYKYFTAWNYEIRLLKNKDYD